MKGHQIRKLRESLDLTATEFAGLLSVQTSSIYRWESAGNRTAPVEGLARNVLELIRNLKLKERKRMVQRLKNGGWMAGLHSLLGMAIKKAA